LDHAILKRNNVQILGAGAPTMMFGHGFGCDQTIWRFVTPDFVERHRVVLFDYVGSGGSNERAYSAGRYNDLRGYTQDVLEICEALDLRELIFVGHSISGMIGILATLAAPERFSHLIMIGSSPCYINDPPDYVGGFEREEIAGLLDLMEKNYNGWAGFLAPLAMKNAERPELAQELEAQFLASDHEIARRFAEVTFSIDARQEVGLASLPTLILQTADDMIVPPEVATFLRRSMPASTLHIMRATGHYPQVSHPAETSRAIREYLTERSGAPEPR
jgi:sigma-B regulation protein RsbQ